MGNESIFMVSNFEWVEDLDYLEEVIYDHPEDNDKGCMLEVDLEYPEELHDSIILIP